MAKDCEGTEIAVGQRVVVYTNFGLKRGTLVNIRPSNTRYVRHLREMIGTHPYYTQEKLDNRENIYHVRLFGEPTIKKVSNRKAILMI